MIDNLSVVQYDDVVATRPPNAAGNARDVSTLLPTFKINVS